MANIGEHGQAERNSGNRADGIGGVHYRKTPMKERRGLLLVAIDRGVDEECDGGVKRRSLAADWLENGRKVAKMPPGVEILSAATAAMVRVSNGLKMLALMKGIYLGGWSHRRWLAGTRKLFERGGRRKPTTKNASPTVNMLHRRRW